MKKMLVTAKYHPEVIFCLAWLAVKRNFLSLHLPAATLDKKSLGRSGGCEGSGFEFGPSGSRVKGI